MRFSLAKKFFPDEPEARLDEIVRRLLQSAGSKKIVRTAGLKEALDLMKGESDMEAFSDLKENLENQDLTAMIKSRFPASRKNASAWTPSAIKDLRPTTTGCTLCWQLSHGCFEAYYDIPLEKRGKQARSKKVWSGSRSYGSGKWTKLSALLQMVNFLWKRHAECGNVARLLIYIGLASESKRRQRFGVSLLSPEP